MHTSILQMSCSTSKFGVLYCLLLQKQQKLEGTCLNSFNWLIHEQLVDLKACTLQMGQDTKVNPFVLTVVPRLAIDLIFKSKIRWHSSWIIWKDSKGPDVNQYIRSCAMYLFDLSVYFSYHFFVWFLESTLDFVWRQYGRTFVWRNDVGVGSLVFFSQRTEVDPWVVWLAWSFDPGLFGGSENSISQLRKLDLGACGKGGHQYPGFKKVAIKGAISTFWITS